MAQGPPEGPHDRDVTERELLKVLATLASESRIYRMHLTEWRGYVERLATDYEPARTLAVSINTALDDVLGAPSHIERLAFEALRDLERRGLGRG